MAHTTQAVQRGSGDAVSALATFRVKLDVSEPLYLNCGFKPSRVEVILKDAGSSADGMWIWHLGMNDGSGADTSTGADDGLVFLIQDNTDADISFSSTLGPAHYHGDELDSSGDSLGTKGEGIVFPASAFASAADDDIAYICCWR